MALTKRGDWWHGESAADLDEYLLKKVLAPLQRGKKRRVVHCRCQSCGHPLFNLFVDDGGRVMRECTACGAYHRVCNLDEMFDDASAGEIVCPCMYGEGEVAVGFALTPSRRRPPKEVGTSEVVVSYLYVAGRCLECGLCGVYSEWKVPPTFLEKMWLDSA